MATKAEMKSTIVAALVIVDNVWDDRHLHISSVHFLFSGFGYLGTFLSFYFFVSLFVGVHPF